MPVDTWGAVVLPESGLALSTAVAGVLLFVLAPRLPALFSPALIRLIGVWLVLTAVILLRVVSEAWLQPAAVSAAAVVVFLAAHRRQTRRPAADDPAESAPQSKERR